jgi:hypothetical protein
MRLLWIRLQIRIQMLLIKTLDTYGRDEGDMLPYRRRYWKLLRRANVRRHMEMNQPMEKIR